MVLSLFMFWLIMSRDISWPMRLADTSCPIMFEYWLIIVLSLFMFWRLSILEEDMSWPILLRCMSLTDMRWSIRLRPIRSDDRYMLEDIWLFLIMFMGDMSRPIMLLVILRMSRLLSLREEESRREVMLVLMRSGLTSASASRLKRLDSLSISFKMRNPSLSAM